MPCPSCGEKIIVVLKCLKCGSENRLRIKENADPIAEAIRHDIKCVKCGQAGFLSK